MQDIDFIFFVACFGDIHLYSTNKAHIKSTFSLTYSPKYIFVPLFKKGLQLDYLQKIIIFCGHWLEPCGFPTAKCRQVFAKQRRHLARILAACGITVSSFLDWIRECPLEKSTGEACLAFFENERSLKTHPFHYFKKQQTACFLK